MAYEDETYQYLQKAVPGLLFGFVHRFQELKQCLLSDCDSWALKTEKVLIHGSFVFGAVSPSRVVWEIMKLLLSRVSTKLGNLLKRPLVDTELQMGLSLLEQMGLVYVWDTVRDGSICMRFNNCDNDFMAQISNIKIRMCNVMDNDEARQLSMCEILFNDSPLILLAGGMLLLTLFATVQFNNGIGAVTLPPTIQPGTNGPANLHSNSMNVFHSVSFSTYPLSHNSPDSEPTSSSTKNCDIPHQDIEAKCPNCGQRWNFHVPKPWMLCCKQVLKVQGKSRSDIVTEDVIKYLFKNITCEHCKKVLKKNLEEIIRQRKRAKK